MKNSKNLKIEPVRRQLTPKYPDQYSVQLDRLLLKRTPLRWQSATVAGTILSAVVFLGLAGCSLQEALSERLPFDDLFDDYITVGFMPIPTSQQVPLFEHGGGTGVYGCVMVTAPVFMSEDDAFAIIKDEFRKKKLTVQLAGDKDVIKNIQIPKVNTDGGIDMKTETGGMKTETGELAFDFIVKDKNIVMEYVSVSDLYAWDSGENKTSIYGCNSKGTAQTLNAGLNNAYSENVHGVFYDPIADTNKQSEDDLRAQVKDFLAWLSQQGII